jgi:hypothetical protein
MATQIKLRRDTYQNWYDNNPVLAQGEPGWDLTNKKLKIGDGATTWRLLSYFDDQQTDLTTVAQNIIPDADNTRDIGSPDKRWRHGYFATGSLYVGDLKLSNDSGRLVVQQVTDAGLISEAPVPDAPGVVTTDRIINGVNTFAITAAGSLELNGSPFTGSGSSDRLVNGANEVILGSSGALSYPNSALQRDIGTIQCPGNVSTVVYTASAQFQHTIKLLIQVEGFEDVETIFDTQSCEMIIAKSFRANDIAASVYGVVHTSAAPLATFTAQWNALANRVEVLCTTPSANSVNVRTFATEITTSD